MRKCSVARSISPRILAPQGVACLLKDKCWEYNRLCPTDARRRNEMIREILGG